MLSTAQQQKFEQETDNPIFDNDGDCLVGSQQQQRNKFMQQRLDDVTQPPPPPPSSPLSSSTPTPPEQQLEQFIQSLKPQNMEAIDDDGGKDMDKKIDIMNNGEQTKQDLEIDLIDSTRQMRNVDERFEQQQQQNLLTESTKS
ncbi:hypothetical protein BLA29_008271, partial [Euroglyphus maynei]